MTIVEPRIARFGEDLRLDSGAVLDGYQLAYETYGTLAPDRANAVLVCHGLSGDAHAMGRHAPEDVRPGWWDIAIGPGRMIDTDRYFVICSNVIGGSGGSTGPGSPDPSTDRPFGIRFPVVTIADMVRAQVRLIDRLGIDRLHAVVGGCLGGHLALHWGIVHGERVRRVIAITVRAASAPYGIALWEVIRRAIRSDPNWRNGDYYGRSWPRLGLGLATMIALLHWMDGDQMETRYGRGRVGAAEPQYGFAPEFAVEHMIAKVAEAETNTMDPNTFLYLTRAMDYFDLTAGHPSLADALRQAGGDYLLVSYERDRRYPVSETERLAEALRQAGRAVRHVILNNSMSHGAFQFDLTGLDPVVRAFLAPP
jgi:homoserine O-acetyltransferase/O-succinyltransferase